MVSHLNIIVLDDNSKNCKDLNTYIEDIGKRYRGSFFLNMVYCSLAVHVADTGID